MRSDIACGYSADRVLEALRNVWNIPLSKGGKVLALTIPECILEDKELDDRRSAVNDGIKLYKKQNL